MIDLVTDGLGNQELESKLFKLANKIIVDSKHQALKFGDSYHAIKNGIINAKAIEELGILLA